MRKIIKSILAVSLFIIILNSCNSNDYTNEKGADDKVDKNLMSNEINDDFIKAEMYGIYHNELLKVHINLHNKVKKLNFISIYDNLRTEFDKLHTNSLTNEEYNFYKKRLISVIGENGELITENYKKITTKWIKKFYSTNIQLILLDLLEEPKSPDEVNVIFEKLISDKEVVASEKNELKKMLNVYNASVIFWGTNDTKVAIESKVACNPAYQVFFADAVGCMFGGLGSVAYSAFVYSAQQQNGGGCI